MSSGPSRRPWPASAPESSTRRTLAPLWLGIDSHSAEREGEGNATYSRNLISALYAGAGEDAFALFAGDPAHAFYRALPPRHRSQAIRVKQGAGILRIALTLGREAARQQVDCLHVQYTAPLGFSRPIVVSVHDLGFLHLPASFPAPLRLGLRLLVPWSIARATRVVTCSEFSRRDIEARYRAAAGKVAVIPLGAAAGFRPRRPEETAEVLARYGLKPGFLFTLGRLNRRKNIERLILAHGRLRAGGAAEAVLVVGGKPDHGVAQVLRRARLSADGSAVRFVSLIPDADLPHFYCGAACFVYPSLFEGFGLPLLEAMACGTPVVSADRAALPELVQGAGLLVDPESVDAIAGAVARVLADPDLARGLGRLGRERSRQYSWAETARQTLAVCREAAGR
jgi:glycosyltransferase involved in cell wall biosynthesis